MKVYFDVFYAGVAFIPFDNIVNPIRTYRRWQGMSIPVIQAKVVDNGSKMIIKSIRNFLVFRIDSPFSLSIYQYQLYYAYL